LLRSRVQGLAHASCEGRVFADVTLKIQLHAMPVSVEQVHLLLVAALCKRIKPQIPRFQRIPQRSGVGFLRREVLESQLVDLAPEKVEAVGAFEVEGLIAGLCMSQSGFVVQSRSQAVKTAVCFVSGASVEAFPT
jgi:hypothetical protein